MNEYCLNVNVLLSRPNMIFAILDVLLTAVCFYCLCVSVCVSVCVHLCLLMGHVD